MTSRNSAETSRWKAAAYLLFLIVGLLEVWLQWTRNFDPLAYSERLDLVLLYLPPIAIVASVLAFVGRDGTLKLLAGGFILVVIFQFLFALLPKWDIHSYFVYGLLNGYDTAWGVMCLIAWPIAMLGSRRTPSWLISALAFLALIAVAAPLSMYWQPERAAFVWDPPPLQSVRDLGLKEAACEGDLAAIGRLVAAGARIEAEADGGWTPLMYAVENSKAEAVRELLALGASPDSQEHVYGRRWRYAMRKSACLPMDTVPTNGATALMIAAANGDVEVAKMLLDAGAHPLRKDNNGKTALELAQAAQQLEVVALLQDVN